MGSETAERTDLISRDEAGTLPGLFAKRVVRSPDAVAYCEHLGDWEEHTWWEMAQRVADLRGALAKSGLKPGDRAAVLLPNGTDWVAFDLAAMANGLITVPLYTNDSPENTAFILADSGARLCLIDNAARWSLIAPLVEANGALEHVWVKNGLDGVAILPRGRSRISTLRTALAQSEPDNSRVLSCAAQDVATIIYTSGTTGRPKGVMLTHSAVLWNAEANSKLIPPLKSDVYLSILPLAHAFERTLGYYLPMMAGSCVVYARSVEQLREDLVTIRPTVLVAVPRLYERVFEAVRREVDAHPLRRGIVALAARLGWELHEFRRGRGAAPSFVARTMLWPLLDRLVARRILAAFGGRMRVPMSGGAALGPAAAQFLIGLGLPIVEGYGLTEAGPVVTSAAIEGSLAGSVGQPLPGLEIRIGEQSELIVRSPSIMQGYWQNRAATAETLSPDGWLRTGDIAEIRGGSVFIIGRLKEIIVLSTGEHVPPSAVEAAILNDPMFEQVCLVGDRRASVVAVVTLNREAWLRLARDLAVDKSDIDSPVACDAILARISEKTQGLPPIWQVRAVLATTTPWTIEDGSLTPTLKVKRRVIEARFEKQIDFLYSRLAQQRRTTPSRRRA